MKKQLVKNSNKFKGHGANYCKLYKYLGITSKLLHVIKNLSIFIDYTHYKFVQVIILFDK